MRPLHIWVAFLLVLVFGTVAVLTAVGVGHHLKVGNSEDHVKSLTSQQWEYWQYLSSELRALGLKDLLEANLRSDPRGARVKGSLFASIHLLGGGDMGQLRISLSRIEPSHYSILGKRMVGGTPRLEREANRLNDRLRKLALESVNAKLQELQVEVASMDLARKEIARHCDEIRKLTGAHVGARYLSPYARSVFATKTPTTLAALLAGCRRAVALAGKSGFSGHGIASIHFANRWEVKGIRKKVLVINTDRLDDLESYVAQLPSSADNDEEWMRVKRAALRLQLRLGLAVSFSPEGSLDERQTLNVPWIESVEQDLTQLPVEEKAVSALRFGWSSNHVSEGSVGAGHLYSIELKGETAPAELSIFLSDRVATLPPASEITHSVRRLNRLLAEGELELGVQLRAATHRNPTTGIEATRRLISRLRSVSPKKRQSIRIAFTRGAQLTLSNRCQKLVLENWQTGNEFAQACAQLEAAYTARDELESSVATRCQNISKLLSNGARVSVRGNIRLREADRTLETLERCVEALAQDRQSKAARNLFGKVDFEALNVVSTQYGPSPRPVKSWASRTLWIPVDVSTERLIAGFAELESETAARRKARDRTMIEQMLEDDRAGATW